MVTLPTVIERGHAYRRLHTFYPNLNLSPSRYYGWLKRPPSARARRDAELKDRIKVIWSDSGEIYGCPRIHAVLLAEGEQVSRKRVARLMRELGIEGVTRRRFKTATKKKDAKARPAPDLVDRNFSAGGPNRLWVADITYVPTWAGWLYLAVVLDAWSRRIVGWAMDSHMRAELVEEALAMAISRRQAKGGVVHHSSRARSTRLWPLGSTAGKRGSSSRWAPWATRTTTRCARASSRRWSAN